MYETPVTALVLTGGGARAAYQVGVLKALARLRRDSGADRRRNPFAVICGTSAGAINAAALACRADDFDRGVADIVGVWEHFRAEQVYRTDALGMVRSGTRWMTMLSLGWALARWRRAQPRSLLDNAPLAELLAQSVPMERLPGLLADHQLRALAISASSYSSGEHVTFYDSAAPVAPWQRTQRVAVRARLNRGHLLASSAIPFVFPATALAHQRGEEWFGDGSMRQMAPISPAIHLGAQRVVVIGAGRMHEPEGRHSARAGYPSLAQVAGHALSGIFLDALATDVERMERINRTVALLPEHLRRATPLRPIKALVIAPSVRLDDVAARHQAALPGSVRALLRVLGGRSADPAARGAALASYLLFEAVYTRELIALGEADTLARRDEVLGFFGWAPGRGGEPLPVAAPNERPSVAPGAASEASTDAGPHEAPQSVPFEP